MPQISRHLLIDLLFRLCGVGVTAWFTYRIGLNYLQDPTRIAGLLLLVSELVSLLVLTLARRPSFRDSDPAYVALAISASFVVPLGIQGYADAALVPAPVAGAIGMIGILWTTYAKLSLGRSFGVVAARRVIKNGGAYGFVRHPVYVGYFLIHIGFFLENASFSNALIIALLCAMQILRALREEGVLSAAPEYREYCRATPYRFIFRVI